ncbi:MAG: 30S ribosomal protein S16 [Candidatus Saccharimonadales bacterium]|nr:30S ribosomal protein S16 [Candidatus Saccharimonadales bacterium]
MLAIRLQRKGRKGLSQFRVILQDSHRSPFSGKVTAYLGSFDPHTKKAQLDKEKIEYYLKNGAQPSNRAAILFKAEGIKLPKWVVIDTTKKGERRNTEKLRGDQPAEKPTEAPSDEAPSESADDNEETEKTPEAANADTESKDEAPTKDESKTEDDKAEKKPPETEPVADATDDKAEDTAEKKSKE